eukprot:SAG11_NODE_648_length_7939_cov_84.614129_2_plen_133_part_00
MDVYPSSCRVPHVLDVSAAVTLDLATPLDTQSALRYDVSAKKLADSTDDSFTNCTHCTAKDNIHSTLKSDDDQPPPVLTATPSQMDSKAPAFLANGVRGKMDSTLSAQEHPRAQICARDFMCKSDSVVLFAL